MNILILSLLAASSIVFGCEITLPQHLLILGESSNSATTIQSKDCEGIVVEDISRLLSELEGRIPSHQLLRMMNQKGHQSLAITPHLIQIQQLKTIIRDQLPMPTGTQIKTTSAINASNFIVLAIGDKVDVRCSGCLFGSHQAVNIDIREFDGNNKSFVAAVDFIKMVRAYRVISPMQSFTAVPNSYLKEEYTESIPHTDLVTDMETLRFYKTNKPVKSGELLRQSDLTAISLVRAGLKTDVILENEMVRIKTQGISRGNGAFGELVEVFHPQKNKKYQGKVVDINKVLVEL